MSTLIKRVCDICDRNIRVRGLNDSEFAMNDSLHLSNDPNDTIMVTDLMVAPFKCNNKTISLVFFTIEKIEEIYEEMLFRYEFERTFILFKI